MGRQRGRECEGGSERERWRTGKLNNSNGNGELQTTDKFLLLVRRIVIILWGCLAEHEAHRVNFTDMFDVTPTCR